MPRTVITDGTVLSMDSEVGVQEGADVLIEDGDIVAIEDDIMESDSRHLDASTSIVLPGFVDAHLHMYQSLIRGIVGDWTLEDYIGTVHGPIDNALRPRDMYLGNLFSAYEQLASGITTVFDFCHAINSPEHADRAIDALEESGIRAVFGHGTPNGTDYRDEWLGESSRPHPEYIRELRRARLSSDDARVTLGMAARGPDLTTQAVAEQDLQLAQELDIPVSMHAGISVPDEYDPTVVLELVDDGYLGPRTSVVHGNSFSPDTVNSLADSHVPIIVTPEIEMQLGYREFATGPLLEAGAAPSIGVDIVSNVGGEMFTQMRMALQTQRVYDNLRCIDRGEDIISHRVSAREALEWATINAASAIGLEDRIGSLTPGKRADIVLLSVDDINTLPGHSPIETVVFQANPSNVETVMVGGEILKRDGALVDPVYPDHEEEFMTAGRRLLNEAGVE